MSTGSFLQRLEQRILLAEVEAVELEIRVGGELHQPAALQLGAVEVGEIVDADHLLAALCELPRHMIADEACRSGNKDGHEMRMIGRGPGARHHTIRDRRLNIGLHLSAASTPRGKPRACRSRRSARFEPPLQDVRLAERELHDRVGRIGVTGSGEDAAPADVEVLERMHPPRRRRPRRASDRRSCASFPCGDCRPRARRRSEGGPSSNQSAIFMRPTSCSARCRAISAAPVAKRAEVQLREPPGEPCLAQAETVALGGEAHAVFRIERLLAGDEDIADMRRTGPRLALHLRGEQRVELQRAGRLQARARR